MTTRIFSRRLRAAAVAAMLTLAVARPAAGAVAPARVVSLVPAITETLFALGLGARVVGVSAYCDYPPEAASRPKVGSFSEPVAEAIVALKPDLVLTSPSPGNEAAVRAIERTGIRVTVVQGDGGITEVRQSLLDIGTAVGEPAAAQRLVADLDARLEAVRERVAGLPRPRVAVVVGREPLVLAGPASYLGELIHLAGGDNVSAAVGGRWPRVGIEFLVTSAPQVLVDLSLSMGESASGPGARWAEAASIPAVVDGRVVTDDASRMLRPGPRLADAAEALARALHPVGERPAAAGAAEEAPR